MKVYTIYTFFFQKKISDSITLQALLLMQLKQRCDRPRVCTVYFICLILLIIMPYTNQPKYLQVLFLKSFVRANALIFRTSKGLLEDEIIPF